MTLDGLTDQEKELLTRIRLEGQQAFFTEAEEEFIRRSSGKRTRHEVAELLNRDYASIKAKAAAMDADLVYEGAYDNPDYLDSEIAIIRTLAGTVPAETIAEHLPLRTERSVRVWAAKHNISLKYTPPPDPPPPKPKTKRQIAKAHILANYKGQRIEKAADITHEVDASVQTVSRALAELVEAGLAIKHGQTRDATWDIQP